MARSIHQRAALDEGLARLQSELRQMASLLDVAIERSIAALMTLDQPLAAKVIAEDAVVNQRRFQAEDDAVHVIATQQPIASDLRFIVAVLMISSEIERMADYAAGIARIAQLHEGRELLRPIHEIPAMAHLVREMLRDAIDAFVKRDEGLAELVAARDDEVDALYRAVYGQLIDIMVGDPSTIDRATWLLWATHNLERMGDRIQNICERTVYEVTGVNRELKLHALPQEP